MVRVGTNLLALLAQAQECVSGMKRIFHRFYYLAESMFVRSAASQLFCVAVVIVALSATGGLLVHYTYPAHYGDTSEAVWWAFLRLTDPGYLGDDQGLLPRIVSTVLTIAGYVVFLGALVAIMTNWLNRLMAYLASGRSQIYEQDHVVIIGWNQRLHALVEELVHTAGRTRRAGGVPAVVILTEEYQPGMRRDLLQKLDPSARGRCRILVRSGNPLEVESLERVDVAHARAVILLAPESRDPAERRAADIVQAKILMHIKSNPNEQGVEPTVVVETSSAANKILLETVGSEGNTEVVVADEFMARLFSQTLRFPGLSRVHRRLLTDTYADAIELETAEDLRVTGKTVGELVGTLDRGTPIGAFRHGRSEAELLGPSYRLQRDDQVVMVVPGEHRSQEAAEGPSETPAWNPLSERGEGWSKVLVVGHSPLLVPLLKELASHPRERFDVVLLWENAAPLEKARLSRMEAHANLRVGFLQGALADLDELAGLAPERFEYILLLADRAKDHLQSDAETILGYVSLDRYLKDNGAEPKFLVELHDEDNRSLLSDVDVIMTSELISHLLAQVAMDRALAWTYDELFTEEGSELRLRGLDGFPNGGRGMTFGQCQRACLARGVIVAGIRRPEDLLLSPPGSHPMATGDKLVTVEWSLPAAEASLAPAV